MPNEQNSLTLSLVIRLLEAQIHYVVAAVILLSAKPQSERVKGQSARVCVHLCAVKFTVLCTTAAAL